MTSSLAEPRPDWYEILAQAIRYETTALEQLGCALVSQGAAITAQNREALSRTSQSILRIMRTLEEAKKRRGSVVHYLTGREDLALDDLEYFLGDPLPLGLDTAREKHRLANLSVAREAKSNRAAIRRGRDADDAFLQDLFSAVADSSAVQR